MDSVMLWPRPATPRRGVQRVRVFFCPTWFLGYQITDSYCGYWNLMICVVPTLGIEFSIMKPGFKRRH